MRSLPILLVLTVGAFGSNVQIENNHIMGLVERAIDPKTVDPTRLSVLSVLRTAMPTGTDTPLPTGDYEPEWYQKLPADVKSLLPSLYPATPTTDGAKVVSDLSTPTATTGSNVTRTTTVGVTNGTLPTASPSTSAFFSAGVRTVIRCETLAAMVWTGVGAAFLFFA